MSKQVPHLPEPAPGHTLVAVWLKDEGEDADGPYGPIGFRYEEPAAAWRPFDPNREPDPWFGYKQAKKLAKKYGVPLEVV